MAPSGLLSGWARAFAALALLLRPAAAASACAAPSPGGEAAKDDSQTHSQSLMQLAARSREKLNASLLQGINELVEPISLAWIYDDSESSRERDLGAKCSKSSECGWHAACSPSGVCTAKPLFAMPRVDALFAALSFVIAGISLAAGVGGGGLFVPMLMLMLSFDARTATGLSQSMLFGGAVAAFIYNLQQSHPLSPSRPIIDFELACLMGPALMAGAQIGSLVHAVAPPAVLLFLLCIVLIDAARKGVASAMKIRARELAIAEVRAKRAEEEVASKPDEPFPEPAPAKTQDSAASSNSPLGPPVGEAAGSDDSGLLSDEAEEEVGVRIRAAQVRLFCVWLFTCAVIVTKGILLDICSPKWWSVVLVSCVCLLAFAFHFASELSAREPVSADSMDFKLLAFPLVRWSLFAGVLAALCGIGGGMVMGPILVALRVPPQVSSATTATTLLLISSSTALVYGCRGLVPQNYSIFLGSVTACGAFTGKSLIGAWVRRTGRESIIVWCLMGITLLSTLLMGVLGLYRVLLLGRTAFAFTSLCVPDHHLHGPTTGAKMHG